MEQDGSPLSLTPEQVAMLVDRGVGTEDIVRLLVQTGTWSEAGAMEIVSSVAQPASVVLSAEPRCQATATTRRRSSQPEKRDEEDLEMAKGFVHTVHRDGRWVNSVEGDQAPLPDSFDRKAGAVEEGRAEARRRKTEHVIHNEDGSIGERNSYGSDPADRRG
jgi:hypothetical protein